MGTVAEAPLRRVAVLADVHGNLSALEAVLADIAREPVDAVVLAGDLAAGPWPRETLDRLLGMPGLVLALRGNADREVVDAGARPPGVAPRGGPPPAVTAWVADQLTEPQRDWLARLPETLRVEVVGLGPVLVCHGSPRSDEEILTAITPDARLRAALAGVDAGLVVCGHTHHQFDRGIDGVRLVNAGSVGMPYQDRPGAYWALLGPDVSLRRTDYDVAATAAAIRQSDYPDAEEAAATLLTPPPAEEVAAHFEGIAERRAREGRV